MMSSVKNPIGDNKPNAQPKAATSNLKLINETLGNFRITDELGKGGMGVVYKAYDRALDRVVAVKVLLPHLAEDEEFIKRFIREARIAAKLEHPNIVQIHAANKSGTLWYIAMQYIKGKTLADYLKVKCFFPIRDALVITRSIATALACAHRIGIIHRDIKPSNIMIDESGQVKVMDFGLARARTVQNRITQTGLYLGTPEYSSPEQCESSAIDERADIYSLGVILYELLAGRVPHVAETPLSLFKKIVEEEPVPLKVINPNIPNSVINLVNKMMAKDKEKRYQSTNEIVNQIDRILKSESLPVMAVASPVRIKESIEPIATPVTPVKRQARRIMGLKRQSVFPLEYVLYGVAVVLLAFLTLVLINRQNTKEEKHQPVTTAAGVVNPKQQINTIVFDFQNMKNQPELKWLEIAVPEMLIVNLNQCEALKATTRPTLLDMMKQIGKRVSLISEGDERAILSSETKSLLNGLGADVVISGKFFVPESPKIRIVISIYRYLDSNRQILQHIADCQIDCADYMKDLLKAVDTLTVKITKELKEKGPAYALAGAERIAMATEPDIAGLMIAQLNQANKMALYLTQTEQEERQKDKNNNNSVTRGKATINAPPKAPSIGAQDKLLKERKPAEKSLSGEDYRDSEREEMNSFVGELAEKEPAKDLESKGAKNADEGKTIQQQSGVGVMNKSKNQAEPAPAGPHNNQEVLISKLKQMYENIQKIENKDLGR